MQVNSVTLGSNAAKTTFRATPEEQLFANLKDRDIRNMAWAKASKDVNDKKHKTIDNLLFYALPVAGGLSASVRSFSPETVAKLGKHNMRAIKLSRFGLITSAWALGLAALGVLWNTKDYLSKKIDFIKNNPVMSSIATFAAGFGVLAAVDKASAKGLIKVLNTVDGKKILPHLRKVRNALNNSKILNKASETISKFPSPIKDMAKSVIEWSPVLVIGTQIGHMFNHQRVKSQVALRNYDELKQAQEMIKEDMADEKIDKNIHKKTISELHNEYQEMLNNNPIISSTTKEPITFEEFIKLATTYV